LVSLGVQGRSNLWDRASRDRRAVARVWSRNSGFFEKQPFEFASTLDGRAKMVLSGRAAIDVDDMKARRFRSST